MRFALALAAALAACGPAPKPPPPPEPPPAPPPPRIDGAWTWQHEATADGVHRVETETWHLTGDAGIVTGYYDRRVWFQSEDGTPFSCNQLPSYELVTRYRIEGTLRAGTVTLAEIGHETAPSPCDDGRRGRARYKGTVSADRLELAWPTGKQVLARTGDPAPPQPIVTPPGPVTGTWQWQTTTPNRDEAELWRLSEADDGVITGVYERTVTVRDADTCDAGPAYTQTERYTVRGTRTGTRVDIAELDSDVTPSPCDVHDGQRILDSARGQLWGNALELIWRGNRRQVLHRAE